MNDGTRNTALILVDLQADFLNRLGLHPPAGELVARAAKLLRTFRAIDLPVIHMRTVVTLNPDNRMPHWKDSDVRCCLAESVGAKPPIELVELDGETLVLKQGFSAPGLVDAVSRRAVTNVVIAGVMTHACVRQAALELYQAGVHVRVAGDAVGSDDPLHAAITRRYLTDRGIPFVPTVRLFQNPSGTGSHSARQILEIGVAEAVRTASEITSEWIRMAPAERSRVAMDLVPLLHREAENLARQMAIRIGKPLRFGRIEIQRAIEMTPLVVRRISESSFERSVGRRASVRRRPHGVVGVITPWNNPVYTPLGKILPAILTGNTVVWKPSPHSFEIARALAKLFVEAGWPTGLVQIIEGEEETGRALMQHAEVSALTITGGRAVGHVAAEICARRYVPLQAELGGNNVALVWKDADLPFAAARVVAGAFDIAGQRCTANRRVVVPYSIREEFLNLIHRESQRLPWGDPLDPETRIGPLVNPASRDYIDGVVNRARAENLEVRHPRGTSPPRSSSCPDAAWFPPTIVISERPESEIVQSETFGPILVVQSGKDWEECLSLCDAVPQGLAAAVFTSSEERIESFLQDARAGILKINESTADAGC